MIISTAQLDSLRRAVALGLSALHKPEPLTPVEWLDDHYYMSKESSYQEGRWETLPFQVAIVNAMGSDDIREVNFIKSARVGYTKMLLGVTAYFLEHKRRNGGIYQPTDSDADAFMKKHVEPMIRDVPALLELAPWYGKRHRDNTLSMKRFANGNGLEILGGKAARNFREKSFDFIIYDELASFDDDIEKEGSPTFLGDKRIEGSTFPKSIRGSTPKVAGQCQIERAASESPHLMRFHVPCPHCGELQTLKWGGPDCDFGIKWEKGKPGTAYYCCEHNGCVIQQSELEQNDGWWICDNSGLKTRNGIDWFEKDSKPAPIPDSLTFHIWTAYSPFTTWTQIVKDFFKAKDDAGKMKTFTNTTLGETFDDTDGAKLEWEVIAGRRELWQAEVPQPAHYLSAGVDVQDDRIEGEVTAWGAGEEHWVVHYFRLYGDPGRSELWDKLREQLTRQYIREDGQPMDIKLACIDSGGHYTDEVYSFCKQRPMQWIPIKGASVYGKPIASFPRKRTRKGVYLTEVGTDNAKDVLYGRLAQVPGSMDKPNPGYRHHPIADWADDDYFKGLTCELKKVDFVKGKRVYRWVNPGHARNEPTDCAVYSLAACRIGQQHFGWNLNRPVAGLNEEPKPIKPATPPPSTARTGGSGWLGGVNKGGWL